MQQFIDALCTIGMIAFFWALIYSIMTKPKTVPVQEKKELPPSPIGLFCSVCHGAAGTVSHEEYMRIARGGEPVYCGWCVIPIEAYKRQKAAR